MALFKKKRTQRLVNEGTEKRTKNKPAQPAKKPQAECPFLYDAGTYGGIRYWCENTTDPGLLGQGTRIPMTDGNQLNNFCTSSYKRCPFNILKR